MARKPAAVPEVGPYNRKEAEALAEMIYRAGWLSVWVVPVLHHYWLNLHPYEVYAQPIGGADVEPVWPLRYFRQRHAALLRELHEFQTRWEDDGGALASQEGWGWAG